MKRVLSLALIFSILGISGMIAATGRTGQAADKKKATSKPAKTAAKTSAKAKPRPQLDQAAVERARKQVKVLDHIYKTTVVLITDKYVQDESSFAAGSAAVALFKSVTDAGHHKVRLIDATGKPYEEANVAKAAFEKEGIKQLKAGKSYYETVEYVDGRPRLQAVTAIPVVSKKCVICHSHYKDAKAGEAIGAITYSLPIE